MELHNWMNFVMTSVTIVVIILVVSIVGPEIIEAYRIADSDKVCLELEKVRYCQIIGMELGSIVVTPGGLFGGSPYNKEACVSENSEKIIKFNELNWKKCKKR